MKKLTLLLTATLLLTSHYIFSEQTTDSEEIEYQENDKFDIVQFEKEEGIYVEPIPEEKKSDTLIPVPVIVPEENIAKENPPAEEILPAEGELLPEESQENDLTAENLGEEVPPVNPDELPPVNEEEQKLLADLPKGFDLMAFFEKEQLLVIPRRILEIGFKNDFGLSNNFFTAKDFFVKELVIDLPAMADDVPDEGWQIDFLLNSELYCNFVLNRKWQFGFANGIESYGFANISKKLFDYLGNGFNLYESLYVDGKVDADAFFYTQAKVGFNIKGFHITAKPSLVKALVHAESSKMYASYQNGKDGSTKTSALAVLSFYGGTDLEPIFENDFSFSSLAGDLFKDLGFDLEACVEHKIIDGLQAGIYTRIPMVPSTLSYSADWEFSFNYEVDSLKTLLQGDAEDPEFEDDKKTYGTASYKLHRPFRLGLEAAWRPFGEWSTIRGLIGLGVKKPYTGDASAFVEYNLGYEVLLLKTFAAWVSSSYQEEIFKHEVGLGVNLRMAEIDLGISLQGSNFKYSFSGSGVGAYLNMCFGF